MEPKVIYEDPMYLVLDKPAGMTVNKADTTKGEQTVQDWLEATFPIFTPKTQMEFLDEQELTFYNRAGIVHRLDKETSGVLIVAKTKEAFLELQRQFKERIVKKTYLALAHGDIRPQEGMINVPVGRLPWNRKRFGVVAGGRESVTKYKALRVIHRGEKEEPLTLVELYPETGRTHQIRVHLKHINHPIFADFLYGGRKQSRSDRKIVQRVFLHAYRISFMHPQTHEIVSYESPLPTQLAEFIDILTKNNNNS